MNQIENFKGKKATVTRRIELTTDTLLEVTDGNGTFEIVSGYQLQDRSSLHTPGSEVIIES